jgi:hypothetical protein
LYSNADLTWAGLRDFAFLDFEVGAGFGDHGDFHFRHFGILLLGMVSRFDAKGGRLV